MSSVPRSLAALACLVAASSLLCAMVLLSTIVAWLSVEFSGPLPHALGFILGVLSLLNAILAIFMMGLDTLRRSFAFLLLVSSTVSLIAGVALMVPWVISYSSFCEECQEPELTSACVEGCEDECCFRGVSVPLALVFLAASALVVVTSLGGVGVAIPYARRGSSSESAKKR